MDEAVLEIPPIDISHIVTEDDEPVDNLFSAKQQRLLVRTLYASWQPEVPFLADANVGLFYNPGEPPLVPDFFLSLNVRVADDWYAREHRTYFLWEFGKSPEVALEIVSNRRGREIDKQARYAGMGIAYYVIFDAQRQVMPQPLTVYRLWQARYRQTDSWLLESVGLGLTMWEGEFEQKYERWLRWTNLNGQLLPLGTELAQQEAARARQEAERAEQEKARADRLAARLRELGIDPDAL